MDQPQQPHPLSHPDEQYIYLNQILVHPSQLPKFTENEAKDLAQLLSQPIVKKYFAIIASNAMYDFLSNDPYTEEKKGALVSRFQLLKGVQHVCAFLINGFKAPKPVPQAPEKKGE